MTTRGVRRALMLYCSKRLFVKFGAPPPEAPVAVATKSAETPAARSPEHSEAHARARCTISSSRSVCARYHRCAGGRPMRPQSLGEAGPTPGAVGAAVGKNPICFVVPCHRVIGSDKSLVGYGGGLWRKKWLLQHEFRVTHGVQTLF
jgi:O-6-methylguanine DNA methyltransferase